MRFDHQKDESVRIISVLTPACGTMQLTRYQGSHAALVHVELARDLKHPKKRRKQMWERNRANERDRKKGADAIIKELGMPQPGRGDIEKYLLWQECEGVCP